MSKINPSCQAVRAVSEETVTAAQLCWESHVVSDMGGSLAVLEVSTIAVTSPTVTQ